MLNGIRNVLTISHVDTRGLVTIAAVTTSGDRPIKEYLT